MTGRPCGYSEGGHKRTLLLVATDRKLGKKSMEMQAVQLMRKDRCGGLHWKQEFLFLACVPASAHSEGIDGVRIYSVSKFGAYP